MTNIVKTIGENLLKNCPANDCVIFKNEYIKYKKIQEDLKGCLLSEYSIRLLEGECRRLSTELLKMVYGNYAVVNYKREIIKNF